jgi:hypothetical protein
MKDKGYVRTIARFESNFNATLKHLIDSLLAHSMTDATSQMGNLVLRLDFNDFYKKYFENHPQLLQFPNNNSPGISIRTANRG